MEALLQRSEKDMKTRIEGLVEICTSEVRQRVTEVDSWITRKDKHNSPRDRDYSGGRSQENSVGTRSGAIRNSLDRNSNSEDNSYT